MIQKPEYGMIQKITVFEENGNPYEVVLKFNAKTLLYYKNFTNRDLMEDYINAVSNDGELIKDRETIDKIESEIEKKEYNKVLEKMNVNKFQEFLENFIAVLFFTAHDTENLTLEEIKYEFLPPEYYANSDFLSAVARVMEFKINPMLEKKTKLIM